MTCMVRSQKSLYFNPARVDLDSTEEISVGAFARRQWLRQIAIGLVGALCITAAVSLYFLLRPTTKLNAATTYPVCRRCVSCGYEDTTRVPFDQTYPMQCPQCGKMTLQQLWRCLQCNKTFVPDQRGGPMICPFCGSEHVGSAVPPEPLSEKP